MLNKVLGKQQVKDIRELSDMLVLLSDTGKTGAGGLAAQAIRTGMVTNPAANFKKGMRFKALNYVLNNPQTIRKAIEFKAGRTNPDAVAQSVAQVMNESYAQITGSGVPLTQRASGLGKGIVSGLQAANRGQTAVRQGGARALLADQEARGTRPPQQMMEIPKVIQPTATDIQIQRTVDPEIARQRNNLRERAKTNPYIAASLLGGLGNAGLL